MRCRAVWCRAFCPALRCCVVLRRAFFRTYSSARYTCCIPVFLLFLHLISLGPHVFAPTQFSPVLPIERDTASKHTTQHRAISSAQAALGIVKSLFAPNHGPLLSAPVTCFNCILPCASVAGVVSRPRSGALVQLLTNIDLLRGPERPPFFSLSTLFRDILLPGRRSGLGCLKQRFSPLFIFYF